MSKSPKLSNIRKGDTVEVTIRATVNNVLDDDDVGGLIVKAKPGMVNVPIRIIKDVKKVEDA